MSVRSNGVNGDPSGAASYQRIVGGENGDVPYEGTQLVDGDDHVEPNVRAANRTVWNFVAMAILFSLNHGCTVACLGLATARLGAIGAWQSGTLYITYTSSAVLGATYITKKLGGRNTIALGMTLYCVYVACFLVATQWGQAERAVALTGAGIGGIGGGVLWTAQGSYFTLAARDYARNLSQPVESANSSLAGTFAFIYLSSEVLMKLLSTVLAVWLNWSAIFGIYTTIAVVSTIGMGFIRDYKSYDRTSANDNDDWSTIFYKVTAAAQLLKKDPKMKYMIGLNAAFGFAGAFLNSYVNGQVVEMALNDPEGQYVGGLTAWLAVVAAALSLVFGKTDKKGLILILGTACFFGVAFPFLVHPDAKSFGLPLLLLVYTFQGAGRATFESTLKATFADFFSYETEGAFANIILQNGLSSSIGYVLSFRLLCSEESNYCVRYTDGSLHDVLTFELLVCGTAILAALGYWRAAAIHRTEPRRFMTAQLIENEDVESSSHGSAGGSRGSREGGE